MSASRHRCIPGFRCAPPRLRGVEAFQRTHGLAVDRAAFAPEREQAPPRAAYIPELGDVGDWRNQFRDMLGRPYEPYASTVGERLLAMPEDEARRVAEQVAGIPIPEDKSEFVDPAAWAAWAAALNEDPNIGPVQRRTFLEIFAYEGGFVPTSNEETATIAGIQDETLQDLAPRLGIAAGAHPRDLSVLQLISAYRAYFDQLHVLGRIGGAVALERISDLPAAVLLADTLFRHGSGAGVHIIQGAINAISPDRVQEDGIFGEGSLRAYLELMADPDSRELLRDEIESRRDVDRPREKERHDYMTSL